VSIEKKNLIEPGDKPGGLRYQFGCEFTPNRRGFSCDLWIPMWSKFERISSRNKTWNSQELISWLLLVLSLGAGIGISTFEQCVFRETWINDRLVLHCNHRSNALHVQCCLWTRLQALCGSFMTKRGKKRLFSCEILHVTVKCTRFYITYENRYKYCPRPKSRLQCRSIQSFDGTYFPSSSYYDWECVWQASRHERQRELREMRSSSIR